MTDNKWTRREFIRDLKSTAALGVATYGVFFQKHTHEHPPEPQEISGTIPGELDGTMSGSVITVTAGLSEATLHVKDSLVSKIT